MKKNITSARKKGDYYQELWGVKLAGDWLLNPEAYQSIQFEVNPDKNEQKDFYLDDIVVTNLAGKYELYQTKHKVDPNNVWTWSELIEPLPKSKKSLLNKWAYSLFRGDLNNQSFYNNTDTAFFITNAGASREVKKYLKNELIDIELIKKSDLVLYKSIEKLIGGQKLTTQFFKKLKFKFSQKSQDEFGIDVRNFYYNTLHVTKAGFDSFIQWIRNRAQDEYTINIGLEEIRKQCEFDIPKPLNEKFIIPSDFQFFDETVHKGILKDLNNINGGIKVIYGEPGSGKSVYLSKLDEQLNKLGVISIKHHYHISPEDDNPMERLNSNRVIDAIKAQFKIHKDDLEELSNINSPGLPLSEFIKKIAEKSVQNKRPFVIIIDGLDHPLKYGADKELKTFLNEISFPQKGVWIVIGMQLVAKPYLPLIITEKCPEKDWIKIDGLNRFSISSLIKKNIISLKLPVDVQQLKELVNKVCEITKGNPLHLRYTLQQLKNINGNTVVNEYSCRDLIPYAGNIEKYYDSLWLKISDIAKNLLLIVCSVNFHFTEQQLIECVSSTLINPSDITSGFNSIAHLIKINYRDELSVYHNSFEIYLKNRVEFEQQKIVLRTNIKKWLEQSSYEYLKWAELRLIECDLGNNTPILNIDRKWLIEAICISSNPSQISFQLEKASKVAFEQNDFAKALKLSYLNNYYINSKSFIEESSELILKESFFQNQNLFEHININELPVKTLSTLACLADSVGKDRIIKAIIDELIERLDYQEYRHEEVPLVTNALLETIIFNRNHKVKKIYDYISQFNDLGITSLLFKTYSSALLSTGQTNKLEELLQYKLTSDEEKAIWYEYLRHGFIKNSHDLSGLLNKKINLSSLELIYLHIKGMPIKNCPILPARDAFPIVLKEHDPNERAYWRDIFYESFLTGILYCLTNKEKVIEDWMKNANNEWSVNAMKSLFEASLAIGHSINKSQVNYKDLFVNLITIPELKWPEDRDSLNIQNAFHDSLNLILKDLMNIKAFFGNSLLFEIDDCKLIDKIPFLFSRKDLLDLSLDYDVAILSKNVFQKIRDEKIKGLIDSVTYFPDRSKGYAEITKLIRLYDNEKTSKPLLIDAINNLLGYGYHKDMFLFEVLEAIDFCAENGLPTEKINNWINKLIPIIEHIGEYTDGDETGYLRDELASLLAKRNRNLLFKNLYYATKNEELYHAENLFKILIESFTYSSDIEIALSSTALDKGSFTILKEQSKNNSGAKIALNNIEEYLGEINYPEEDRGNTTPYTPEIIDYSTIKPDDLKSYLESNFENKWQMSDYLKGWSKYWTDNYDKKEVYKICKELIKKYGIQNVSGELLDTIFPLAQEFDNQEAFEYLCSAQTNDHGWQKYWTDKKKAEQRWNIVKTLFPKRYLEFFKKSTEGGVPLSTGVEYFLQFDDQAVAEEITDSSILFAEELMANLALPDIEWQKDKNSIDLIDLLFQRLLWPSTITQERAATSISRLLIESKDKKDIFTRLLVWISQQKMESTIAIGLLVILKAIFLVRDISELSYISYKDIENSIKINSIVVDKLVSEIAELLKSTKSFELNYEKIEIPPINYVISKFFLGHIKTFLAPIYMIRAKEIEKATGKPFIKYWSYVSDKIVENTSTILDSNQTYFMGRSQNDDFVIGFSSKVSQVYRSAFIRVLQYFHSQKEIPNDIYLEWAYATLPVELSFWKISPKPIPSWWPQLNDGEVSQKSNIVSLSLKKPIETLCEIRDGKYLLAAEGSIKPGIDWQSTPPMHSFSLIGFGYKVTGKQLPSPEEIAKEVLYSQTITRIPTKTNNPFHFLEDQSNFILIGDEFTQLKDMFIYPLTSRNDDFCIGLWQYYRDREISLNVTPELSKNLNLKIEEDKWSYQDLNSRNIIEYSDWLGGLRERYDRDLPIHHGQHLMIDKLYLDEWLKHHNLRLGYILKSVYRVKKYSYDKVQSYYDYKLLNVSTIITP
ncbi:MAG: ATP-binding protein [Candidatus Shapirobacteria bacterium]|nr:ATP-binding protein [Candidatus Shapirobacteria bacterium]